MSNTCNQCYFYRMNGFTGNHSDPFDVIMNGKCYQVYCIPPDKNQPGKIISSDKFFDPFSVCPFDYDFDS
ncbi:hypothetical protein QKC54_gp0859 [Megavirus baoshan]|uniref:Uncharacterized protein n=1 Tax=Megavirus baoshan TaxID=2496520 RepID=A0A8K1T139_9VIRU|nr:hypothetical protein QKC54_gp0859 [Megavirus baoshan]UFX99770.1 hypothetical protein Mb0213 [Megavirus baoshan]